MIGVIGLGHMGGAIARRLLSLGAEVVVFDQEVDRIAQLAEAGALAAHSSRAVGDSASMVLTCLPSRQAALQVAREVAKGSMVEIYVELSTLGRSVLRELHAILSSADVTLVDAPVSGGPVGAKAGTLCLMMSGPSWALDRVIDSAGRKMAGTILRIGDEAGQAQVCKIVNNGISMTAFLVSCEVISAGVARGMDATSLVTVINAGTGRNSATTDKFPLFILSGTFNMGATVKSALKDLDLYLHEADNVGLPRGVIAATRDLWQKAVDALDPTADASTIIRYFESFTKVSVSD